MVIEVSLGYSLLLFFIFLKLLLFFLKTFTDLYFLKILKTFKLSNFSKIIIDYSLATTYDTYYGNKNMY